MPSKPEQDRTASKPTVLVIDDDTSLLTVMARALAAAGYSVLADPNPEHALAFFEENWIDLVVTDHDMPGMTGTALIERVLQISPSTKALLISGGASRESPGPGIGFLEKPFAPPRLIEAVRELLAGEPESGGAVEESIADRVRKLEDTVCRLEEKIARLERNPENDPPEKI